MRQLVVLKLGQGSWQDGFPVVTVQHTVQQTIGQQTIGQQTIGQQTGLLHSTHPNPTAQTVPTQLVGALPAAPALAALYNQWRTLYIALNQRLSMRRPTDLRIEKTMGIEIEPEGITNVSPALLESLSQQLKQALDHWLESDSFRRVDRRLRTHLASTDEIRLIIETEEPLLRRFPWQLWSFFDDYPFAEVGLSAPEYGRPRRVQRVPTGKVRILAVLGNSVGIDVQQDRMLLEQLPQVETVFLVEPTRPQLDQQLWDERGWDILFFAGHSTSQPDGTSGKIAINPDDSLTIAQLKNALTAAINRGLQFAIFNSCDGLGLARAMADLNIPQLVVMREPVPDQVAQAFLKHWLAAFAGGRSFYRAVREAREKLQGLESQFPCASYLPVICQNPTEIPADWQDLLAPIPPGQQSEKSATAAATTIQASRPANPKVKLKIALLASLATTGLLMGLRWLGGLESLELRAFDQVLRARAPEVADPRILVVEVTQDDTNEYGYPLADKTLAEALAKLAQMQPRAIGVDMHRYQPRGTGRAQLLQQFQTHSNLFTVCWSASTDKNFAPPPEFSETQRITQVGFSDLLLDGDAADNGVVRRQLLSYDPKVANSPPDCSTPYSFSFQLAFRYLYDEKIEPLQVNPNGNWQFGDVSFAKLPPRFVGYQRLDGLSSQVMLNYRQALPGQRVTLQQVLQGQVSRNFVENRIVLVGTTAPIARDTFLTPYGELAGIWVHAHQVSQMLSAVLDQRPLIWGLPQSGPVQWGDALWVWAWAAVGSGLAWWLRSWRWLLLANGIAVFLLYQLCLLALMQGGWLPIVPAALSLLLTSAVVYVVRYRVKPLNPVK
ncbi:MAG: CHASE2 domain-containing protein [Elainella sp. C42_A2020_010]|nr:CHASE2 domain-containing protein [Elainella sp. C42_A2020_010]